jgi:hypothetical protein
MPRPTFHISDQTQSSQAESDDRPVVSTTTRQAVIKVPVNSIYPDYFQTRVILPEKIATPYFTGQITTQAAANMIIVAADQDEGFNRVVHELIMLGESMALEGQIEPITGYFKDRNFYIETGERRFWGTVLYYTVEKLDLNEAHLKAISVETPSRLRQILENEQSSSPNSLTRARSIAAIILANHKIDPKPGENRHDYYRRVKGVRASPEDWILIENKMNIKQRHCYYYLAMLELPNDLLEIVNNYNISERALRDYLHLPIESVRQVINQIVSQIIANESEGENPGVINERIPSKKRVHNIIPSQKVAAKFYRELMTLSNGKGKYNIDDLAYDIYSISGNRIDRVIDTLEGLVETIKKNRSKY